MRTDNQPNDFETSGAVPATKKDFADDALSSTQQDDDFAQSSDSYNDDEDDEDDYEDEAPADKAKKGLFEKKPRMPKPKKPKSGNNITILIAAFIAVLVAGALFIWMLFTYRSTSIAVAEETHALTATARVIMTADKIDEDTVLSVPNINTDFYFLTVYADAVPDGAITDPSDLLGLTVNRDVPKGAIITQSDVSDYGNVVDENTIEISFPAANIQYAVGGDIRPGEHVNIAVLKDGTYTHAYTTSIYRMYDSNGNEVDDGALANIYSILVPSEDSATFYTAIQNGTLIVERLFS